MIITSTVPLIFPGLLTIQAGRNEFAEADIPPQCHSKLAHYARSRVIGGYSPSAEFIAKAAELPKAKAKAAVPATLNSLKAGVPVR